MVEQSPLQTLIGRVLGGRYRLERPVATGGMAQVWEATDEVLARRVAVKVLHPHLAADESFVIRFRQEAVAAARLSHPAIVSIYDTVTDDGVEAIVMELVRGRTMRELLDERGALEPAHAVAIIAPVADALDVAHRAGVVHRDIKPANILLSDDGRVLVADFGIAKAGADLTGTSTTLGTAKYLAPEQVRGETVDGRADVYALGIVLYEALCGRPPFTADTEAATALARLHQEPLRPRQIRAGITRPVEEIVVKAMAREPAGRFATAGEFRASLLAAMRGEPLPDPVTVAGGDPTVAVVSAASVRDHTPPGGLPPGAAAGRAAVTPPFTRTERGWLLPTLVVLLLAVALVVAGILVTEGGTPQGQGSGGPTDATSADGGSAIEIADVRSFDPSPGDGVEKDGLLENVTDEKGDTYWETEGYLDRRFGMKPGVGIVIVLEDEAALGELAITSPTNDWAFEVFVGDGEAEDLDAWGDPVVSKEHVPRGRAVVDLGGVEGSAMLIWIVDLGDAPPNTKASIAEVAIGPP